MKWNLYYLVLRKNFTENWFMKDESTEKQSHSLTEVSSDLNAATLQFVYYLWIFTHNSENNSGPTGFCETNQHISATNVGNCVCKGTFHSKWKFSRIPLTLRLMVKFFTPQNISEASEKPCCSFSPKHQKNLESYFERTGSVSIPPTPSLLKLQDSKMILKNIIYTFSADIFPADAKLKF